MAHDSGYSLQRPCIGSILLRAKAVICLGAIIGLLAGFTLLLILPPTYTSTAMLAFPLSEKQGSAEKVSAVGLSAAAARDIMQSRRAAVAVANKLHLKKSWHLRTDAEVAARYRQALRGEITDGGSLALTVTDSSKRRAYRLLAAALEDFDARVNDLGYNAAKHNVSLLEAQLTRAQTLAQAATKKLLAMQQKTGPTSFPDISKKLADQYAQLQSELTAAKLDAAETARLLDVQAKNARMLIMACQDPNPGAENFLGRFYQEAVDAEAKVNTLKAAATPDPVAVKEAEAIFDGIKRQLKDEIDRQMGLLSTGSAPVIREALMKAASASARVAALEGQLKALKPQLDGLPETQATYVTLKTSLDANLNAIKIVAEALTKARVVANAQGRTYSTIDPPALPMSPNAKQPAPFLILGLVAGLAVSAHFAYWRAIKAWKSDMISETSSSIFVELPAENIAEEPLEKTDCAC